MSAQPIDVGPFRLVIEDTLAWFIFDPARQRGRPESRTAGVTDLERVLRIYTGELKSRRLVLDFQDVPVIDSLQIGALLALNKACREYGRLELAHVSEGVMRLLRISAIDRLFAYVDETVEL